MRRAAIAAAALGVAAACAPAPVQPVARTPASSAPSANTPVRDAAAAASAARSDEPAPLQLAPAEPAAPGAPCGALDCRRFDAPAAALRYVLRSAPVVIGIGEAHAPAGSEAMLSTAARFTEQLLPVLSARTSHLIVELLNPNPACPSAARPLEQAQKPVLEAQSPHNQSDYVSLGTRAKALGIEPFVLTPSCEEFQAIADAGEDAILRTLSTIASITERVAKGALVQDRKAGRDAIVIAYGGALHNDLAPSPSRASFCYGDALQQFSGGRYIALDLIVREFIRDNAAWQALPWYASFDPKQYPESSVLLQTAPHSYVLFFPSAPAGSAPAGSAPAGSAPAE